MNGRWGAIVVAAGRGERFGRPKQFLPVAGRPLVAWSLHTFAAMAEIAEIVVATEAAWLDAMRAVLDALGTAIPATVVVGGATRQASAANALRALSASCDHVLVHDGARPLVRADDVRSAMRAVRAGCGAVLAARAVDTIKLVEPSTMRVVETLDRQRLWAAQTPQLATVDDLRRAHAAARSSGFEATDDVALLERVGIDVVVVPATSENFKVTHPEDLMRAETLLRERQAVEAAP